MAQTDALLDRLEELLAGIDQLDEAVRSDVYELLDGIDTLHRQAVHALAGAVDDEDLRQARTQHPAVDWLLTAYAVGRDERSAAEAALDEIRPYIHSHNGEVELLDVEGGVVHVRLSGACAGCTASAITLRHGVEEALDEHLPGFVGLEVTEEEAEPHGPPGPTLVDLDTSLLDEGGGA